MVCSAVRLLLLRLPISRISFKSLVHVSELSAGGGPGRNCEPVPITHGVSRRTGGFDRQRRSARRCPASCRAGNFPSCRRIVDCAQRDNSSRRFFAKFDPLRLRLRFGNARKRSRERRVEVGFLIGIKRHQNIIGGGSSRRFLGSRAFCREVELVRAYRRSIA